MDRRRITVFPPAQGSRATRLPAPLTRAGVVAAVPPGGADLLLGDRRHLDLRLEPVEDRPEAEVLPRDGRSTGPAARVALAHHLHEQLDPPAEIGLVAEV